MISAEELREITSNDKLTEAMEWVQERIISNAKRGCRSINFIGEHIPNYFDIRFAMAKELRELGYTVSFTDYSFSISW